VHGAHTGPRAVVPAETGTTICSVPLLVELNVRSLRSFSSAPVADDFASRTKTLQRSAASCSPAVNGRVSTAPRGRTRTRPRGRTLSPHQVLEDRHRVRDHVLNICVLGDGRELGDERESVLEVHGRRDGMIALRSNDRPHVTARTGPAQQLARPEPPQHATAWPLRGPGWADRAESATRVHLAEGA
jgi:hypothetical protein